MNRRPTPSEAFRSAPDGPADTGPPPAAVGADAELNRLDNRALATVGVATLVTWVVPQGSLSMFLSRPPGQPELPLLGYLAVVLIVLSLVCAGLGAVTAWRALRTRPLTADDEATATAHARDAVADKREDTARAVGLLVVALGLTVASSLTAVVWRFLVEGPAF